MTRLELLILSQEQPLETFSAFIASVAAGLVYRCC